MFSSTRVAFRLGGGDTALWNRFAQSPTVSLQTLGSEFPISAKLPPELSPTLGLTAASSPKLLFPSKEGNPDGARSCPGRF